MQVFSSIGKKVCTFSFYILLELLIYVFFAGFPDFCKYSMIFFNFHLQIAANLCNFLATKNCFFFHIKEIFTHALNFSDNTNRYVRKFIEECKNFLSRFVWLQCAVLPAGKIDAIQANVSKEKTMLKLFITSSYNIITL